MKKLFTILLVVMLITSMTIPAFAAANIVPIGKTISFKMPTIKTVNVSYSTVYENAKTSIQSNLAKSLLKTYSWKY